MKVENDFVYLDIYALKEDMRKKLHLTDEEIKFTEEDKELINSSKYVDMEELSILVEKAGFKNFEIPNEMGISKAMYTMAFKPTSKNHRGLRMRTIVAILNAIRNRNINDPFDKILIREVKK